MTTSKFIKESLVKGRKVYSVKSIKQNGNKGKEIKLAYVLNENTVSTEQTRVFWNQSLNEILDQI